jgi:hypothetical protein
MDFMLTISPHKLILKKDTAIHILKYEMVNVLRTFWQKLKRAKSIMNYELQMVAAKKKKRYHSDALLLLYVKIQCEYFGVPVASSNWAKPMLGFFFFCSQSKSLRNREPGLRTDCLFGKLNEKIIFMFNISHFSFSFDGSKKV